MMASHEQAARELEVQVSEQELEIKDLHAALGLGPADAPRSPRPGSVPPSPRGTTSGAKELTPHQLAAQENLLTRLRAEVRQRCAAAAAAAAAAAGPAARQAHRPRLLP
jgi:hypothetical protein